jgi:hypothetical protein
MIVANPRFFYVLPIIRVNLQVIPSKPLSSKRSGIAISFWFSSLPTFLQNNLNIGLTRKILMIRELTARRTLDPFGGCGMPLRTCLQCSDFKEITCNAAGEFPSFSLGWTKGEQRVEYRVRNPAHWAGQSDAIRRAEIVPGFRVVHL